MPSFTFIYQHDENIKKLSRNPFEDDISLGARPSKDGRVFLINGMLLIMFDVLVPIGISVILKRSTYVYIYMI